MPIGFPAFPARSQRPRDRLLNVRMGAVAEMAQRGRQVRWPDEDAVDARHGGNLLECVRRLPRLDLDEHAELVGNPVVIAGDASVPIAAQHRRDSAVAIRRIARRLDRLARLVRRLHVGHEQRLRSGVEDPLEDDRVVPRRPDDRRHARALENAQLIDDAADVERRVLGVDQHPVRLRVGQDLGDDAMPRLAPEADLRRPRGDSGLEVIGG